MSNFKYYEPYTVTSECNDVMYCSVDFDDATSDDLFETELECVEAYAFENGLISSEQVLSDRFEEEVLPDIVATWEFGDDPDTIMVNEEFNNWTDALCQDGELHQIQYDQYCYIGKYSD